MHTPNSCANLVDNLRRTAIEEAVDALDQSMLTLEAAEAVDAPVSETGFRARLRCNLMRLTALDATSDNDRLLRLDALDRCRALVGDEQDDYRAALSVMARDHGLWQRERDVAGNLARSH